jgi:hypothetical protein
MFEKKIVKEKLSRIIIDRDYYKKLAENYLKEKNQTIEDCERKLKQKDEDLASQK